MPSFVEGLALRAHGQFPAAVYLVLLATGAYLILRWWLLSRGVDDVGTKASRLVVFAVIGFSVTFVASWSMVVAYLEFTR